MPDTSPEESASPGGAKNVHARVAQLEEEVRRLRASERLLQSALDTLAVRTAVLDANGVVLAANRAWMLFSREHGCGLHLVPEGANYLAAVETAAGPSTGDGTGFAAGARAVIRGDADAFAAELSCSGPGGERWFASRISRIRDTGPPRFLVLHEDITGRREALKALRESEERYRSLVTASMDAVLLNTVDGRVLSANEAACRMFGCSMDELIESRREDLVDNTDPRAATAWDERMRTGRFSGELTFRRKNGSTFPGEISSAVFSLPNGEIRSSVAIRDISARKGIEEAMRFQSEILANASEGVNLVRAEDGILVYANPRFGAMFGYGTGELEGKHVSILNNPAWRNPELTAGEISRCLAEHGRWEGDLANVRKDGSPFWTHAVVSRMEHSTHGVSFVSVQSDITERRQMEEALRESEMRYHELFNHISNGVSIFEAVDGGADFVFRDFNKAAERIDGDRREDVVGKRLLEIRAGTLDFGIMDVLRRVWKTGEPEHFPAAFYRDEHLSGWFENFVYRLPSGEVVAVFDDVTAHKQTEQTLLDNQKRLQALARELSHLEERERRRIAVLLHDQVGQLLSAMRVRLDAWKTSKSPEQKRELLATVEMLIDQVIEDIRSLTFELSPPILYELGLAPAVERLGEGLCRGAGVDFLFRDGGSGIKIANELAGELYRAARELVLNALKHAGPRRVSVSLAGSGAELRLTVEDDGAGVERGQLERAMNGLGGTFGLFSIRERLRDFSGRLEMESWPGSGTRAAVTVPLPPSGEPEERLA